jgi:hypothetical protein
MFKSFVGNILCLLDNSYKPESFIKERLSVVIKMVDIYSGWFKGYEEALDIFKESGIIKGIEISHIDPNNVSYDAGIIKDSGLKFNIHMPFFKGDNFKNNPICVTLII